MDSINKISVNGTTYAIDGSVTSVAGQTGEVTAAQIASALDTYGYSPANISSGSGTVTQVTAGVGLNTTSDDTGTDGGNITTNGTLYLTKSGVTAGSYGPSANVTGNNNATMSVPYITVDKYGRVTSIENKTYTAKNNTYTIPTGFAYSAISYSCDTQTTSGAISINGTTPLHVITLNGNASSVSLSSNPPDGHSCHVIFTSTTARTVAIAHDATNRVCPGAANLSFSVPANGYVEVDFLKANNKVYVRGV